MRRPASSTIKFSLLASLIILGTAASLAALWPSALNLARHQAAQLVVAGDQADRGEAEVDYRLATRLDPTNHAAFAGLARTQILNGHADEALSTLSRAGEGSQVEQLKVRTLIELGRYQQAADEAAQLTAPGRTDPDLTLAAFALALANRASDITPLAVRVSSPEAAQRIQRAQAGNLTLAAELYVSGLLQSSSALLLKQPTSYERNLLLASIAYTRHTPDALTHATDFLSVAITLNPASIEARQLLAKVYRDRDQAADATQQDILITKLRVGRP